MDPRQVLRETFGYDSFRPGQQDVIARLVAGQDTIALMPTGGGKSLCFQIPAICRPGTGLIISPLVALMTDQVASLQSAGVQAACIHSGMGTDEIHRTLHQFAQGALQILYVAPERAQTDPFKRRLATANISLVAIDEAHCVDKWGHDFREDYLGLHALRTFTGNAPWFACTATADHRSIEVIREQLHMGDAEVFQGSYDRPNLTYTVVDTTARGVELAEWIRGQYAGEAGIVYCRSRARTEELAKELRGEGLNALAYHAGLDNVLRRAVEQRFRSEPGLIVVATVAFGMGIDRSDVRFVVHAEPPDSIDAYVQETGRAGRDGLPASARLYVDGRTIARTMRELDDGTGPEARIKQNRFRAFLGYLEANGCRRQVLLGFFGESHAGKCNACDNCLDPPQTWDAREAARAVLFGVRNTGQRFGSSYVLDVIQGRATAKVVQNRHQVAEGFGSAGTWTGTQLQTVFRHLLARGILRSDVHGGLALTGLEPDWDAPLLMRHAKVASTAKPTKAARPTKPKPTVQGDGPDPKLWEALRAVRLKLANEKGLPAFTIFHDSTLQQIATVRPRNEGQFRAISGVGGVKFERYGSVFMDAILKHEESNPVDL